MMEPGDIPVMPRGVRMHFDKVRDTWVLLAPERAIPLDAIGHAIVTEIDGRRSFGAIVEDLAGKYAAPAQQISEDAGGFLATLRERRFLDVIR